MKTTHSAEYERVRKRDEYTQQVREIVVREIFLYREQRGQKCSNCGIIQGAELNGNPEYYCEHFDDKIRKKIKKEVETAWQTLMGSLVVGEPQ